MNQKEKGKVLEAQANFYSSDDYVKDETTNLMMAAPTEETCNANDGFVCKVRLFLCQTITNVKLLSKGERR